MSNNSNLEFRKIKSLKYLYEINKNGTIFRNVKSKKQLKIKLDNHHSKDGYYVTFVRIDGKSKRVMIHSAVAECWLGDRPDGCEVDHIDRNSHNNDYRNLRYVTRSEQMKNRDHSRISQYGSKNLENARKDRMKQVEILSDFMFVHFESIAACSRFLGIMYDVNSEIIRGRLKQKRKHIFDFDISYS